LSTAVCVCVCVWVCVGVCVEQRAGRWAEGGRSAALI